MITIRYITSDDADAAEVFGDIYADNYDWRVGLDIDEFLDCVSDDTNYYIGAFDGDSLVGVVSLGGADGVVSEASYKDGMLSDLYVIPAYRNSGIGSMLVQYALREAQKEYTGVYADILDDNLFEYYKQFGFELVDGGLIYVRL